MTNPKPLSAVPLTEASERLLKVLDRRLPDQTWPWDRLREIEAEAAREAVARYVREQAAKCATCGDTRDARRHKPVSECWGGNCVAPEKHHEFALATLQEPVE